MDDLRAARAPKPEKKENNTIRRKLEILDGAAASGKDVLEFCQDFNKANPNNPLDSSKPARTVEITMPRGRALQASRARANQVRPATAGLARAYRFFGACLLSFAPHKASSQRLSESGKRERYR